MNIADRLAALGGYAPPKEAYMLDEDTRDIAGDVLGPDGRLQVLPAAYWATTTPQERAVFGTRHGIYCFPTVELVAHLRELIGGRTAIEIGAGNGVLAEALGIVATDSFQQLEPKYQALYEAQGQAIVPYGPNVINLPASRAINRYRPQVVISCWVTHKYSASRHDAGGNEGGVDEEAVLYDCETYIAVGNERVHQKVAPRKIWTRPHTITYPDFVYSRAVNGSREFIAVWPGRRAASKAHR